MFTVYRPKKGPKLNNQFTNRADGIAGGGNMSFDYHIPSNGPN
jgi:hypothetical protein